jgi:ferredoxin
MRVTVDPGRCQGHALCVLNAPQLFDLDEVSSHAVVVVENVPADLAEQARSTVDSCPERAISVTQ